MNALERNTMSPLELAVWAAAFVAKLEDRGMLPSHVDETADAVWGADVVVQRLRDFTAMDERNARADEATSKHRLRFYREHGDWTYAGCSCGYRPRAGQDPEELLAIHYTHVGIYQSLAMLEKDSPPITTNGADMDGADSSPV